MFCILIVLLFFLSIFLNPHDIKRNDKVNINIGDAHIYSEHVEAVKTQLLRTPCDSPKLNILGPRKKSIDDYKIDDFVIENYLPQSIIKAPMIA